VGGNGFVVVLGVGFFWVGEVSFVLAVEYGI